jgi:hypothetical protein
MGVQVDAVSRLQDVNEIGTKSKCRFVVFGDRDVQYEVAATFLGGPEVDETLPVVALPHRD